MAEIGVVFVVSFVGAALGATLGVWLAWRKIRMEVMARLSSRVLSHDRTTGL